MWIGRTDMRQYHTNLWGLHNLDWNIKGLWRDASLRARVGIDIFLDEERIFSKLEEIGEWIKREHFMLCQSWGQVRNHTEHCTWGQTWVSIVVQLFITYMPWQPLWNFWLFIKWFISFFYRIWILISCRFSDQNFHQFHSEEWQHLCLSTSLMESWENELDFLCIEKSWWYGHNLPRFLE